MGLESILPAGLFVGRKALGHVIYLQQFEKGRHCRGQQPSRHSELTSASRADCCKDVPRHLLNLSYRGRQSTSG